MVRIFQIQGFRIPDRREAGEKKWLLLKVLQKGESINYYR